MYPQPYENTFYYSNMVNNKPINNGIDQQNQRKRHGSYDSFLNKQQQQQQQQQQQANQQGNSQQASNQVGNSVNSSSYQQVPQLLSAPPSSQPDLSTSNYLLMPAPAPSSYASATSGSSGMQRSHSYHSGISNASAGQYDGGQSGANGAPLYVDLYMPHHPHAHHPPPPPPMQQHHVPPPLGPPHHHQTGAPIYQPIVQQQAQQLVMGAQSNANNASTPLYGNVDSSLG